MSAAYRVSYRGPSGECPDCVIPIDSPCSDCVAEQAATIKNTIVSVRGGAWRPSEVTIRKIEYLGPWFPPIHPAESFDDKASV